MLVGPGLAGWSVVREFRKLDTAPSAYNETA